MRSSFSLRSLLVLACVGAFSACGSDDGGGGEGTGGASPSTGGTSSGGASAVGGSGQAGGADNVLTPEELRELAPTLSNEQLVNYVCLIQGGNAEFRECTTEADDDCEARYLAALAGPCAATERALNECKVGAALWLCADTFPYVYAPDCVTQYDANTACHEQ